jgi:tRNA 5-methylaminomethyl-2-thiouridine biosynthesis bifunctional protein
VLTHHEALALRRESGHWLIEGRSAGPTATVLASAETLVVANAADARAFAPLSWLGIIPVRGQLDMVTASTETAPLKCVVTGAEYIAPTAAPGGERHIMGATFDRDNLDLAPRPADSAEIRAGVARLVPAAARLNTPTESRTAIRATSLDALPLVGWVPEHDLYMSTYAQLHRGLRAEDFPPAPTVPGLYVITGLGSRGVLNAGLCAEHLATQICAEPSPLAPELERCLLPARFLVRKLKAR